MAGNKEQFTEEELAGLSDEERAALEGDETDEATLAEIAGEDDDEGADDDFGKDVGDGKPKEGKAAGEDGAADAAGDDGAGDDAADDDAGKDGKDGKDSADDGDDEDEDAGTQASGRDDEPEFVPTVPVEDVTKAKERLGEIKTEKQALQQKYKEGEITLEEMLEQRDALDEESTNLRIKVSQAEQAAETNRRAAEQRWSLAQEVFFENHPEYDAEKNPALYGALDAQVKALARDERNKHRSLTWFLTEADRLVKEQLGGARRTAEDEGGGKRDGKEGAGKPAEGDGKRPQRRPKPADLSKVPQTLSNLPAAAEAETGKEDEFAHLDKLSGIELEMELAKLPPEKADQYLRAGAR